MGIQTTAFPYCAIGVGIPQWFATAEAYCFRFRCRPCISASSSQLASSWTSRADYIGVRTLFAFVRDIATGQWDPTADLPVRRLSPEQESRPRIWAPCDVLLHLFHSFTVSVNILSPEPMPPPQPQNTALRHQVIAIYRELLNLSKDWPESAGGPARFRARLHGAFAARAGIRDEAEIRAGIARAEFVRKGAFVARGPIIRQSAVLRQRVTDLACRNRSIVSLCGPCRRVSLSRSMCSKCSV